MIRAWLAVMVSQSLVTSEERDLHEQEAGRAMIGGGGGGAGGRAERCCVRVA